MAREEVSSHGVTRTMMSRNLDETIKIEMRCSRYGFFASFLFFSFLFFSFLSFSFLFLSIHLSVDLLVFIVSHFIDNSLNRHAIQLFDIQHLLTVWYPGNQYETGTDSINQMMIDR